MPTSLIVFDMRTGLILLLLGISWSCDYDHFSTPEPPHPVTLEVNCTIRELKLLHATGPEQIESDLVIGGVVSANDRTDNLYKTLLLQDESGALAVQIDRYDLSLLYPEGAFVYVCCRGLGVTLESGTYQLGLPTGESGQIAGISPQTLIEQHVVNSGRHMLLTPKIVTISALSESLCGELVTIRHLLFDQGGTMTWAISGTHDPLGLPQAREVAAHDDHMGLLYVYTSGYCDFADEFVPAGYLTLTGILAQRGDGSFRLILRSLNDVQQE